MATATTCEAAAVDDLKIGEVKISVKILSYSDYSSIYVSLTALGSVFVVFNVELVVVLVVELVGVEIFHQI